MASIRFAAAPELFDLRSRSRASFISHGEQRGHSDVRSDIISAVKDHTSDKTSGIPYAGLLLTLLLIDAIWLGLIAKTFYRDQLGSLMLPSLNFAVAAIFYLVVRPDIEAGSLWTTMGYGALLELAAYSAYDITNLATLKDWPATLAIVDLIWGTALNAVASACGYAAVRQFG